MSLARKHRERILAKASVAVSPSIEGGLALPVAAGPAATAAAQIKLRLTHDLRRLKEIQSLERKIAAKREMLPEYDAWISGVLTAAEATGHGAAEDVVPTIMIWRIDTGDYAGALALADYVLRHDVPLPSRYERTAPALIVEEIADAALKALGNGDAFALDVLEHVERLTAEADMHDEIRAKLMKAIGLELARQADASGVRDAQDRALDALRAAQKLNDRVGVKDRIKRIERAIVKADAEQPNPAQAG